MGPVANVGVSAHTLWCHCYRVMQFPCVGVDVCVVSLCTSIPIKKAVCTLVPPAAENCAEIDTKNLVLRNATSSFCGEKTNTTVVGY